MINYLKLKNFRRHRDEHFEFGPGLNVICGPNWAGKTTLLSAIAYALFGTKAAQGSAADLITDGETDMQVQVGFSVDGENYFVTRGPKKADLKAGSAKHKTIATGQTPVTEEIESLIGSSTKDFLDFNVTRQEDSAHLLSLGSAKLGEYVSRVTGVDLIDSVLDKLRMEVVRADATFNAHLDSSQEISDLERSFADKSGANNRSKASLQMLEAGVALKTEENTQLAEAATAARAQFAASQEAKRALAVQNGILKNAEDMLKTAEEARPGVPEGDPEEASAKHMGLVDARAYVLWHDDVKAQLEEGVSSGEAGLGSFAGPDPDPVDVQSAMDAKVAADDASAEAQLKHEQAAKAAENAMCPYCMRAFEDKNPAQLEEEAVLAHEVAMQAQEAAEVANAALSEAMTKSASVREWVERKKQWEDYLEERKAELEKHMALRFQRVTDEEVQLVADQSAKVTAEWAAYTRAMEEVARRHVDVERAKQAVIEAKGSGLEKGPTAGEVDAAERASQELANELHSMMLEAHSLEAAISNTSNVLVNIETSINRLRRDQDLRVAAGKRLKDTKELQTYLRKNRERFTESFWTQLLAHASKFVKDATSGDVTSIGIGNGFTYTENGLERAIQGNASGMQKAIISTAIKLSLVASLGAKFEVLFFDEVTASAGDDNSLLLTSLLARAGQQSLLVTHRQADSAVADRVIAVPSR